jgi:hypothetical protein
LDDQSLRAGLAARRADLPVEIRTRKKRSKLGEIKGENGSSLVDCHLAVGEEQRPRGLKRIF